MRWAATCPNLGSAQLLMERTLPAHIVCFRSQPVTDKEQLLHLSPGKRTLASAESERLRFVWFG